jgi:glutathione S-transferase
MVFTSVRSALLHFTNNQHTGRDTDYKISSSRCLNPTEEALVDAWLSSIHYFVDWPLTVLGNGQVVCVDEASEASSYRIRLDQAISRINKHLSDHRLYLVTDQPTMADVSLWVSMKRVKDIQTQNNNTGEIQWKNRQCSNLQDWYQRMKKICGEEYR